MLDTSIHSSTSMFGLQTRRLPAPENRDEEISLGWNLACNVVEVDYKLVLAAGRLEKVMTPELVEQMRVDTNRSKRGSWLDAFAYNAFSIALPVAARASGYSEADAFGIMALTFYGGLAATIGTGILDSELMRRHYTKFFRAMHPALG